MEAGLEPVLASSEVLDARLPLVPLAARFSQRLAHAVEYHVSHPKPQPRDSKPTLETLPLVPLAARLSQRLAQAVVPQVSHPEPQTTNLTHPETQTTNLLNPKPQTLHPEHQTPNLTAYLRSQNLSRPSRRTRPTRRRAPWISLHLQIYTGTPSNPACTIAHAVLHNITDNSQVDTLGVRCEFVNV